MENTKETVNFTLTMPEELRSELQRHDEVNWSAVIRRALKEHLIKVKIAETIASKSKLTKKDAEEISKKINDSVSKRLGLR